MEKERYAHCFLAAICAIIFAGCSQAQDSASRALDNAGSVARSIGEAPWYVGRDGHTDAAGYGPSNPQDDEISVVDDTATDRTPAEVEEDLRGEPDDPSNHSKQRNW